LSVEPSDALAARFACMAQAEGVSLPVMRRLLFMPVNEPNDRVRAKRIICEQLPHPAGLQWNETRRLPHCLGSGIRGGFLADIVLSEVFGR